MATQKRKPIQCAKDCTQDATDCTKEGRHGDRSQNIDKKWRDHEIYRLHVAGKSNAEISKLVGCHRNTVANGIKLGRVPPEPEQVNRLVVLDKLALDIHEEAMRSDIVLQSGEPLRVKVAGAYLKLRGILSEETPTGTVVNLTIIQEKLNENRAAGFAAYGYARAMQAGDN